MKDFRVPGVAWALLIVATIATAHENEAALAAIGVSPFYVDMAVTLLVAVLKGMKLGTEELNLALDLLGRLIPKVKQEVISPPPQEGMRSAVGHISTASEVLEIERAVPDRPNKVVTFFFG